MEQKLAELVERLQDAHKDRLVSVILYGSGAVGDHHDKFSDLNVLCVLTGITVSDLARSERVFEWWRKLGNPAPLLLSEEEVGASADCFPIEFHDMAERRRVLFGKDVIAGLTIAGTFYRAQVEHELRSKLLRLRQTAGGVLSDGKALLRLMLDSVSTFCVLARHALLLGGTDVGSRKRDIVNKLGELGADPAPFRTLLDLREQKKDDTTVEPATLLAAYLGQIEAVIAYVDGLQR
jgi:predicted nucleotidyltransferase